MAAYLVYFNRQCGATTPRGRSRPVTDEAHDLVPEPEVITRRSFEHVSHGHDSLPDRLPVSRDEYMRIVSLTGGDGLFPVSFGQSRCLSALAYQAEGPNFSCNTASDLPVVKKLTVHS